MTNKKLRVGWFTFTCCEDSTIIFTELLNEHYREWKNLIDFRHAKTIQSNNISLDDPPGSEASMDVSFVEGSITGDEQAEKLKKIRALSKKVVAIGACACIGMPSAQRNYFDEKTNVEIDFLLERFKYWEKVKKVNEVITVDDYVQGCPMDEASFLTVLNKYLKEFNII